MAASSWCGSNSVAMYTSKARLKRQRPVVRPVKGVHGSGWQASGARSRLKCAQLSNQRIAILVRRLNNAEKQDRAAVLQWRQAAVVVARDAAMGTTVLQDKAQRLGRFTVVVHHQDALTAEASQCGVAQRISPRISLPLAVENVHGTQRVALRISAGSVATSKAGSTECSRLTSAPEFSRPPCPGLRCR